MTAGSSRSSSSARQMPRLISSTAALSSTAAETAIKLNPDLLLPYAVLAMVKGLDWPIDFECAPAEPPRKTGPTSLVDLLLAAECRGDLFYEKIIRRRNLLSPTIRASELLPDFSHPRVHDTDTAAKIAVAISESFRSDDLGARAAGRIDGRIAASRTHAIRAR